MLLIINMVFQNPARANRPFSMYAKNSPALRGCLTITLTPKHTTILLLFRILLLNNLAE
jgi:hypothetical protein